MTRTSATPTCSGRRPGVAATRRRTGGFTLLEILLVVTIIGILASVVVLGATDVGRQRTIRAEAERLALAVELARDEARLRNEVWGLLVGARSYGFHRYDQAKDLWHPVERREFAADTTESGIEFTIRGARERPGSRTQNFPWMEPGGEAAELRIEGSNREEGRAPDVVIYPGGELTPFEIVVFGGEAYAAWVARSDGIQRARAVVEGEVAKVDDDLAAWLLDQDLVR